MQKRGDRLIVSPKDLIQYGESEFAAWMERWCVETGAQTPPPDEMTRVLERLGEEREQQFLWELEQSGQAVYRLQKRGSFKATVAAMQAGHPMIYQAALELQTATDHWQGYADFLVRVPLRSRLGDWSYVPMECKLALHAKPYFVIQACAYCELLAQVQGRMPEQFQLLLGTNEIQVHRTEDYLHYYRQVKTAFLQFLERFDPDETPLPSMGNHGVWQEVADRELQQRDHLGLVANITRNQIKKLESAGVTTVAHLAQLAPDTRIPRLDPQITQRLRQQAQLQKARREGEPPPYCLLPLDPEKPRRGLALLPPASPLDVYFDMEGYPLSSEGRGGEMGVPARTQSGGKAKKQAKTPPHSRSHAQGLEYLFGASYEAGSDKTASNQVDGQLQFQAWWAHNPTMERQAFEAFIDWVYDRWQRDPTLHVYHYAPYEPTALKRLMGRYGTREEELDTLLRHQVFVDLYQIVSQSLQIGEPAYSIKNLEHLYWRKRQGDVKTAQASVVQYYQWMQIRDGDTPETSAILAEIRDYNRDDCDSTHALTQWLRSLQIQHDRPYLPPDNQPEPESNEPASPKAQIRATLQQLATDLLTQTHSDFSVLTSDVPLSPPHPNPSCPPLAVPSPRRKAPLLALIPVAQNGRN